MSDSFSNEASRLANDSPCLPDFAIPVLVLAPRAELETACRRFSWLQNYRSAVVEAGLTQVVKRLSPLCFWLDSKRLAATGELEEIVARRIEFSLVKFSNSLVQHRDFLRDRHQFLVLAKHLRLNAQNSPVGLGERFIELGLRLGELRIVASIDSPSDELSGYLRALNEDSEL